jgi:hypothetical protein
VFAPVAALGAITSFALLALFFDPWLVVGLAIDVMILLAVLVAGWTPASLA